MSDRKLDDFLADRTASAMKRIEEKKSIKRLRKASASTLAQTASGSSKRTRSNKSTKPKRLVIRVF